MSRLRDRVRRLSGVRGLWLVAATLVLGGTVGATTSALIHAGNHRVIGTVTAADGASGIHIANFAFAPETLTVAPGQKVTWTNADTVAHTSTGADRRWNSGPLEPGASFSVTFVTPGTYLYGCSIHPFMKAKVVVGN